MQFVVVNNTLKEERISKDLERADQKAIPVNIIYPPNYPAEPAVLLNELISPADALKVLARMEAIQNSLPQNKAKEAQVASQNLK